MPTERVILHVDMDAFFAAIEQRDHPEYRGRPVVVGADPQGGAGRGVVSTCSYEARRFGIHSAQPISEAWRRCPDAVFVRPRGDVYAAVSRVVRAVFDEFTPLVEPVSIDEAFLDVTGTVHLFGTKRELAAALLARIRDATGGLTASVGVAPNKSIAKIASDLDKPNGLTVVEPDEVESFLRPLPVGKLWGVGRRMRESLADLGVHTVGDLAELGADELERRFGRHGAHLAALAAGRDDRPVEPGSEVKSVGHEHTFDEDTTDAALVEATLMRLCEKVAHRLRKAGLRGRTVTAKIRFEDFTTLTRAATGDEPLDTAPEIYAIARGNLFGAWPRGRALRLIGVTLSGFGEARGGPQQTSLFDAAPTAGEEPDKRRRLAEAIDAIKDRYGEDAVQRGASLRREPPEADE